MVKLVCFCFFGRQRGLNSFKAQNSNFSISHNGYCLEKADWNNVTVKRLGVYFDETLTMNKQIMNLKKYCNYQLHHLYSVNSSLTTSVKLKLVKGLILSKIDFCNSIFINLPKYQLKKIQKIINSCLRYTFNLNWNASVSLYHLKAHILPFDYRLKYKACLTVFKCIHNIAPLYLTDLLHPYSPFLL